MTLKRRGVLAAGAAAAMSAPALLAYGAGAPRVVVIGGGAGGATAARYIARDSGGAIDVTLVEPSRTYFSCFFSNLYLGGFKSIDQIGHTYGRLAAQHGVNVVHDWAIGGVRAAQQGSLAGGQVLGYD